tara:strand:+ start:1107 stop:1502 length:396 start_codon:yes stop_codon:yes gene_type:complete
MNCEICGNKIIDIITIRIDTGILRVCNSCSKLGKQMSPNLNTNKKRIIKNIKNNLDNFDYDDELVVNYGNIIRQSREKKGLSHEALGLQINEKVSILKKLESEKLQPPDQLTKKLERFLNVKLLRKNENSS